MNQFVTGVEPESPAPKIHNPYWEVVKQKLGPSMFGAGYLEIGGGLRGGMDGFMFREYATNRWAWCASDPLSVQFVAEYSKGAILDPMAGTGYWCYLLQQWGIDCAATDANPPDPHLGEDWNFCHSDTDTFVPVARGEAEYVVAVYGVAADASWTLLLSWPPMSESADRALAAYPGDRLIYIGEGPGGCTADQDFFARLERDWELVAAHRPVQFFGMHDVIMVFDRIEKPSAP